MPDPPSLFVECPEAQGVEDLYAGASINVITATAFIWNLAKSAGWRRDDMEKLLDFMHSRLLPAGNKMPRSTYLMRQLVGEPDMYDCTYRMCPTGCVLWHPRDERRLGIRRNAPGECPKCFRPLFEKWDNRWAPRCSVVYYGIASIVRYELHFITKHETGCKCERKYFGEPLCSYSLTGVHLITTDFTSVKRSIARSGCAD